MAEQEVRPEDRVLESLPVFAPHIERLKVREPDPDYKYRWCSDTEDRVTFLKELNYEIVYTEDSDGERTPRRVGTSILMRCPRSEYERREHIRRVRARQMLESPRSKVKTTADALGVEATDSSREYRAPLSQGMTEKVDSNPREGVITRADVQKFNSTPKE